MFTDLLQPVWSVNVSCKDARNVVFLRHNKNIKVSMLMLIADVVVGKQIQRGATVLVAPKICSSSVALV